MKGKLVKITVLFFIVMILFTILSRVTYNMSMATVETTQPARETMGPVIETKATVEGKKEVALNTKENQIIESILVTIGQAVEKDQVLYTLDLKELDKQIKEKSQELELNKVQLANAQNTLQSTIDSQQLQISQAKSDYDRAVAESDAAIQRAQEELSLAQEKYDRYIQNPEQFPELSKEQLESDIIFYKSGPEQGYTLLEAGMFGFYAPEDGHMPCIAVTEAQPATKIVFKIPVKG